MSALPYVLPEESEVQGSGGASLEAVRIAQQIANNQHQQQCLIWSAQPYNKVEVIAQVLALRERERHLRERLMVAKASARMFQKVAKLFSLVGR